MGNYRILHIDDDSDIRLVVACSLRTQPDLEVRSCASGSEGIAAAMEWSPDLIICDVMMPDLDARRHWRSCGRPRGPANWRSCS